jgi:hypothetical protein
MPHDGTPTIYQLDEPLIANCEYNNSVTTTAQNVVKALRMIGLNHTIGFCSRNFTMH